MKKDYNIYYYDCAHIYTHTHTHTYGRYIYIIRQTDYWAIVKLTRPPATQYYIHRVCGVNRTVWNWTRRLHTHTHTHTTCCEVHIYIYNNNSIIVFILFFPFFSPDKTKLQGTPHHGTLRIPIAYIICISIYLTCSAFARDRSFRIYVCVCRACVGHTVLCDISFYTHSFAIMSSVNIIMFMCVPSNFPRKCAYLQYVHA